ncbi:MAG TPA: SGNH/GDSL hydrolase family protein [Rudaea sp.]|nr:SGNH/GDSL hydrolase family protein [Rudaea sp.]
MHSTLPGPNARQELGYLLATFALGPLLIAQAVRVRRNVVRLDEPPGPRSGCEGAGAPLRLLIAGDSAAAGVGARTQEEALSGQLIAALRPACMVHWKLVAQTGHTVRDVIGQLRALAPERFDVAVVSIGVNDATGRTRSGKWIERQTTLIELLKVKFGVAHILLSSLPPMHVFPALPQPLRWYLGMRAGQLNRMLQAIAEADACCEFLQIDFPFEPGYMAADGFHPAAPAYSAWAAAAARAIRHRIGAQAQHESPLFANAAASSACSSAIQPIR